MREILEHFSDHEIHRFAAGQVLMERGQTSGRIYALIEGAIEVRNGDVRVDFVREPGAVFGEIAALLGEGHTAEVRAAEDSALYVIEDPRQFLIDHPAVHLHVSELLAKRVSHLVQYLSNVREQFEGHDHIGMVGEVLDQLVLRQPRRRAVKNPPIEE